MKSLMKLAVAAIVMVAAQNASAISLRFKFKVFSSGPSIYACNAGLMHKPSNHQVCYFEGTTNACTKSDCSDGKVCNTKCICSSAGGGEYLMDYMKAEVADWKDNGDTSTNNYVASSKQAGQTSFATLHTDSTAWDKTIRNLSFNLGSELYSAQYFVDICYRGPQIEYFEDQVTSTFNLLAQASATDFIADGVNPGDNSRDGLNMTPSFKYTQISDLKVQAFLVCDLQGQGDFQFARNKEGKYNTSKNEAIFALGADQLPTAAGSKDFFRASSLTSATASATNLLSVDVNAATVKAPRFCKVRYVFSETNGNQTNTNGYVVNLRKWQRHGAEMCTYTNVNEIAQQ